MAADAQMPVLIPKQVLPQHHQEKQHYDQHAGEFYRSFSEPEPASGLFDQGCLYRCDQLAPNHNSFTLFDSNHDRPVFSSGGGPPSFAFRFVVRQVRQQQGAEDFAELAPLASVIFRRPCQLLGPKTGSGSYQVANGGEVVDSLLLPALLVSANEPGRAQASDLGPAADHTVHYDGFEMSRHKIFQLAIKPMSLEYAYLLLIH